MEIVSLEDLVVKCEIHLVTQKKKKKKKKKKKYG